MNVSIIGGTGFVGSYIVDRIVEDGHTPHLLVRPGSVAKVERPDVSKQFSGDVTDPTSLDACLAGADAVIYLIGLLREFPKRGITFEEMQFRGVERTIDAAQRNGVKRFLLMSANGVKEQGTDYQRTKYRAEEQLKASGLDWTIFRPSVIFGDPRGRMEFCTQLKQEIIDSPLPIPLFFDGLDVSAAGQFELAPVSVRDVALAFARALNEPASIGKTYSLCGPEALPWKGILSTIATAAGKKKMMLPAPAMIVKGIAGAMDRWAWFPISRDQLAMLLEGNTCESDEAFGELGITPERFSAPAISYLRKA